MISQPVPFPLHPIVRTSDGEAHCGCGWAACSRIGKHPALLWRDLEYTGLDWETVSAGLTSGRGVGLKTGRSPKGSGVVVVDIDGEAALESWYALGGTLGEGREVLTGRLEGGIQVYIDAESIGFSVKNSRSALAPGIDIRGEGGFVVMEGSPHKSGNFYQLWSLPEAEPIACPDFLREWFRNQPLPELVQQYDGDIQDHDERTYRRELYSKWLAEAEPCVDGQGGDERLFEVVQYGAYDLALPTEDVLELVEEVFDPRCLPPWGDELCARVLHKAHDAKTSSTRARIEPLPNPKNDPELAAIFAPVDLDPNTIDLSDVEAVAERSANKAKRPKGIHFGSWDEIVEPPTWLVQGLIPIETVGMFVAIGSSTKTWTAIDMGIAIATGEPWLGRYPVRKGKVVVVDYESGIYELRRRVRLLYPSGDIENLGTWVFPDGLNLEDHELWKELAKIPGLQLVIVDSLSAGSGVDEENDKRAAEALKIAGTLAEKVGFATLFVHHATKSDGGGDARKTVRGSSAIYAALDWAYSFESVEETTDDEGGAIRRMRMVCIKPCMTSRPAPVQIQLADESGLTWFEDDDLVGPDEGSSSKKTKAKTPEEIQAAIRLVLATGEIMTKEVIRERVRGNTQAVNREVDQLEANRLVRKIGKGYTADGPEHREARVFDLLRRHPFHKSEGGIATMAGVKKEDVLELVGEGRIAKSGDGKWLVYPKKASS